MTIKDDLIAARKLIEKPADWERLGGWNALLRVAGEEGAFPAYELLEQMTPTKLRHYRYYEIDPARTHGDIMRLFDRAINAAEA